MTKRSIAGMGVIAFALLAGMAGRSGNAAAAEIRVMTSGALAAPFQDLAPIIEASTGHKVVTILGSSQGGASDSIPERLKRGEVAHVLLLGRESLDALVAQGLVIRGSERDIVSSRMAMSVRKGIPKPDISTVEAFRKTLLEARSIAYSASVSGTYLSTVAFAQLGIADQVLPKARRIVSERVGAVLSRGEADVGFQQISELLPFADTTQFVGPLPEGVQKVTLFSAGVAAATPDPALSKLLVDFMSSPQAHGMIRKYALDPVSATREQQQLASAFAPQGVLRVVINLGNPVLATRRDSQTAPTGVSVDLAGELARRLGLVVQPIVVDSARAAVEKLRKGEADVGFFALDPARNEGIDFTPPYLELEGAYAVANRSPLRSVAEVDRVGVRIVVGHGSAYDLFLSRELKAASLVRAPTSQAVVPLLFEQGLDVAANVRQQLEADMQRRPGELRLLPGRFMTIQQAMGLAAGRDPTAAQFLARFIDDVKATGFLADALRRHGVDGPAAVPSVVTEGTCQALQGLHVPRGSLSLPSAGATVTSAAFVASDAAGNSNGAYCRLLASVHPVDPAAPEIQLQLNLPKAWNGRALQMGGGGYNGRIPNTLQAPSNGLRDGPTPLASGYITFASDSGHQAANGDDASFGLNDEALANYGGQHIRKTRDVAVAIARVLYGQAPRRVYFAGGSTGGREALTAALRWPDAYDGVISNYPTANFLGLRLWGAALAKAIYTDNSAGWIPPAMVKRIASEAMTACDELDGIADGVVSNMVACRAGAPARVARLACKDIHRPDCLTPAQIERTLRVYHDGYSTSWTSIDGLRGYGGYNSLEGVEMNVGEQSAYANPPISGPHAHHADRAAQFARYLMSRDPTFDLLDLDVQKPGKWLPRLQQLAGLIGATSSDYSAFEARGGKVLLLQGQDDVSVSPIDNTRLHSRIVDRMGQSRVDGFLRFYLVPGLGHGVGSFQPSWDNLKVLDDWVELGIAPPDSPVATDVSPQGRGRQRPLCRYPTWPRYDGSGPPQLAASFRCVR